MQLSSPLVRKLVNFGYLDQNKLLSPSNSDSSLAESICNASGMSANELSHKAANLFQSPHLSIKNVDLELIPDGKERNEKLIKNLKKEINILRKENRTIIKEFEKKEEQLISDFQNQIR